MWQSSPGSCGVTLSGSASKGEPLLVLSES